MLHGLGIFTVWQQTIADLARTHVLEGLRKHALDNDAELVSVSTQPIESLPELRKRAQTTTNFSAFQAFSSRDFRGDVDGLQRRLRIGSGEERLRPSGSWTIRRPLPQQKRQRRGSGWLPGHPDILAFEP